MYGLTLAAAFMLASTQQVARSAVAPRPAVAVAPASGFATSPPQAQGQDPADSLYRRARQALNRNQYRIAADLFQQLRATYPKSAYVPDSFYWEAFARYRRGNESELRAALAMLDTQQARYPNAATLESGDARSLEARIQGSLASGGDERAARALAEQASLATTIAPAAAPRPPRAPAPPRAPRPARAGQWGGGACADEGDDVQAAALNALIQMDSDKALPILKKVLARRDEGSLCLRRKAVFLVSQHEGPETETMLLDAARNDPDAEVRGQAVFWLSQVDTPRAAAALDSIALTSKDPDLQEKAMFALGQQDTPEARRALRRYAERTDISEELRGKAVFWLGQSEDPDDAAFLRSMYGRVRDEELKERILFAVGAQEDAASIKFLRDVARNAAEPLEVRKKALFWLGERDETTGAELASLYGTFADRELKEHLIFILAQKDEKAATDKLLDIARREPDKELRKKAIFWLSQSDDPRVAEFLAELLEKP